MGIFHTKSGFLEAAATGDIARLEEYLKIKKTNWCAVEEKKTGETALHKAAGTGHLTAVKLLLAQDPAGRRHWVNDTDGSNLTALHHATIGGHTEIARLLLAEKSVLDGSNRFPVHAAVVYNRLDILKDLIATGKADLTANQPPALYSAVTEGTLECVKLLLELGANPNVPYLRRERWESRQAFISIYSEADESSPASPLFAAVQGNKTEVASALIGAGAQIAAVELPLHCAAFNGNLLLAEMLLTAKIGGINATNSFGRTALHIACEKNQPEMVKFLLAHGASPTIPDKKGVTPMAVAQQFCLKDLFDLLRDYKKTPAPAPTKDAAPAGQNQTAPAAAVETAAAAKPETVIIWKPHPAAADGQSQPAAAKPEPAADSGENWTLSGKIVLAHTLELPEIRRRLTEIFNFESRERLIITENLALKSEIMSTPESFDNIAEESLSRAFREFQRLGGAMDEATVFRNRRVKMTAKPS